ncbi:hypothetical protein KCM76_02930 [Zooshikella marina]|uniref:hypothetical protein n=1 Tax=Zooshikella ganghwensis TaxID=202772 RepID=UPI001BAE5E6D|nr:hypothetical protein [Zooshikella ganghwensis]MBU2704916.1 hypothetical protein [Zooshikella ganghwensis]
MSRHLEDIDDDLPSMAIARDDIADRAIHRRSPGKVNQPEVRTRTNPFWILLLLLLVVAVTGGGVFGYQQLTALQAELNTTKQAYDKAVQQLQDVTGKVSATDASLTESGSKIQQAIDKIQIDLKLAHSEIRKLWDLSNKRNRAAITKVTKQLAQQEKLLAELQPVSSQLKQTNQSLQVLEKRYKQVSSDTQQAKKSVKQVQALQQALAKLEKQLQSLSSQVSVASTEQLATQAALQEQLAQLDKQVSGKQLQSDVAAKLKSVDESIRSIDAFRRQVNSQLLALKNEVRQLRNR